MKEAYLWPEGINIIHCSIYQDGRPGSETSAVTLPDTLDLFHSLDDAGIKRVYGKPPGLLERESTKPV